MRILFYQLAVISLVALVAGCAEGTTGRGEPSDAGPAMDIGPVLPPPGGGTDTGMPRVDAGPMMGVDSSAPMVDAGGGSDGGSPDAGGPDPVDAGPPDTGTTTTAECMAALAAVQFTFESGAAGWSHGAMDNVSHPSWPLDPWEVGAPTAGPSACAEGSSCFGTDLSDNYAQCGRADLRSPAVDLSPCAGQSLVLRWDQWYSFWSGSYALETWYDGGLVEISNDGGSTWSALDASVYSGTIRINPNRGLFAECLSAYSFYVHERPGFVGSSGDWETVEVALSASMLTSDFRIRMAWASGVSSDTTNAGLSRLETQPGWYVDDVRIEPE